MVAQKCEPPIICEVWWRRNGRHLSFMRYSVAEIGTTFGTENCGAEFGTAFCTRGSDGTEIGATNHIQGMVARKSAPSRTFRAFPEEERVASCVVSLLYFLYTHIYVSLQI